MRILIDLMEKFANFFLVLQHRRIHLGSTGSERIKRDTSEGFFPFLFWWGARGMGGEAEETRGGLSIEWVERIRGLKCMSGLDCCVVWL